MTVVIFIFTLYLYYILLFSIFQRTSVCHARFSERDGLQSYNIFLNYQNISKKYFIFLSNVCCFVSQATSLDCGCKGTTFFQTTKIFLSFFLNFFLTHCTSKRKILIAWRFLCLKTCFYSFFEAFFCFFSPLQWCFFRVFGFFRVFSIKKRSKIDLFFRAK